MNWKTRRLSQRKSETDGSRSPQAQVTAKDLNFQISTTEDDVFQSSHKLEESVLAMFGFSRADYEPRPSNQPADGGSTAESKVN